MISTGRPGSPSSLALNGGLDCGRSPSADGSTSAPVLPALRSVEVDIGSQGTPLGVDGHDLAKGSEVRQTDLEVALQASGALDRRVHHVRPVGGSQHEHALQLFDAIHLGEKLTHDALGCTRVVAPAPGNKGIDLIEKQNAGGSLASLLEHLPNAPL